MNARVSVKNHSPQFLSVLLLCLWLPALQAAVVGTNPANGHYYELIASSVIYDTAATQATTYSYMGVAGHLATISDTAENSYIINNVYPSAWHVTWIGCKQTSPGVYVQVTGGACPYTHFGTGEPATTDYGMGLKGTGYSGVWEGQLSSATPYGEFVVEYDVPFAPGGVSTGLRLWMKGDAATDLTGIQSLSSGGSGPVASGGQINNNPSMHFNGILMALIGWIPAAT